MHSFSLFSSFKFVAPGAGGTQYQRLSGSLLEGTDRDEVQPWTFNPIRFFWWILSWAIPGMGMFLEAYFIFRRASRSGASRSKLSWDVCLHNNQTLNCVCRQLQLAPAQLH